MKDVLLTIFAIIAVWIIWFSVVDAPDGNTREDVNATPSAANNEKSRGVKDGYETASSIFKDKIRITNIGNAYSNNPSTEYIVLEAPGSNKNPILITGWILKNSSGKSAMVGKAAKLPRIGNINEETDLYLAPGEKIFVVTGHSPIGVSFQENICSGYLEQFQDFTPPITKECPAISQDRKEGLSQSCINYISSLPRCDIYTKNIPGDLSELCANYIYNDINYNSCVQSYEKYSGFYKAEWRIFLGKDEELWSNKSELIRLYDTSGNLIDSRSY